jgi:anti-sigma factor RsiW
MTSQRETEDDLACQALVELVTDYLEDALPAATRRRLEAHLAGCDGCRVYLAQIEQTIGSTRAFAAADLSPADRVEFLRLFREWAQQ